MKLTNMELSVVQSNDNGVFGGQYENDFEYTYKDVTYRVRIEQHIKRVIRIGTEKEVDVAELLNMEDYLEQLLFLFDGRFYPISCATIIDENEDPKKYQNEVYNHFNNRLPIYNSIDLCRNSFMKLINFKDVNFEKAIIKWPHVLNELDIAFNMLLYCLSDIRMPVDCKISSVIEIAKPIGEIIEKYDKNFHMKRTGKFKNLELKTALETILELSRLKYLTKK